MDSQVHSICLVSLINWIFLCYLFIDLVFLAESECKIQTSQKMLDIESNILGCGHEYNPCAMSANILKIWYSVELVFGGGKYLILRSYTNCQVIKGMGFVKFFHSTMIIDTIDFLWPMLVNLLWILYELENLPSFL